MRANRVIYALMGKKGFDLERKNKYCAIKKTLS